MSKVNTNSRVKMNIQFTNVAEAQEIQDYTDKLAKRLGIPITPRMALLYAVRNKKT